MALSNDTQFAATENAVWDLQVLQGRYGAEVIGRRVLNKSALVSDSGQLIHIPVKPRFAGGTVGSNGDFTAEAQTLTDVQVNVNTWKYVSIEIVDKASKQSIVTLETEMPSQFGAKLAEFSEIDLANLFSGVNMGGTGTGTGIGNPGVGVSFIEDTALAAVLFARRRNIPLEDLSWILSPEAFYLGWLTKERVTSAMHTGEPKSVLTTNFRQKILGIPAYESTLLNGSTAIDDNGALLNAATAPNQNGTSAALLIHREAFAIATQFNNKYERYRKTPAGNLATGIIAHELYGLVTVRATHGLVIYLKNS